MIPAGPGNTDAQFELIEAYRPIAYSGTPDFLKVLLDTAQKLGKDVTSLRRGLVSGAALPSSLRQELASRGVEALQCYATADLGLITYESRAREGMIVYANDAFCRATGYSRAELESLSPAQLVAPESIAATRP